MKKLFIYILSVIAIVASCAKVDDMTERFSAQGREIVFTVANTNSPVTKAIVDTTAMVDTFGVYGYVVPGDYSVTGGYLMKNAEYDKDGNAVDGPYYWPKSDNYTGIDFIFTAYSQFVSAPTWENDTLKIAVPKLTQTLIDNPEDFNDVLWAQAQYNHHQNGNVGAEHEKVALNFRHALSWLQFKGEVTNPNVKWVKVKQISFGEYRDSIPGVAAIDPIPAYNDTTDTWVNLKNGTNAVATSTALKGPGETTYTNAVPIPAALVAEIKSYYSIDGGAAGDYDLRLGLSVWPKTVTYKQLRVVKDIPAEYKMTVDMHGEGIMMDFFDAIKYLKDNGYYLQEGSTGGKPAVFSNNYVILDAYVNGAAYTITTLNWGEANSVPQYTIVEHPEVPGVPGVDAIPASGSEGLFVDGFLCLPTKDTLTATPLATYGTEKDTTLNYLSAQVDTLFTNDNKVLGNTLIIPQPVPQNITVVFDICISNPNADDVVFTDRKITRTINTGKDADKDADYVASWGASNKYIYYFNFNGDILDFTVSISDWTLSDTDFHVWDYTE
jgi:hypothetical protein